MYLTTFLPKKRGCLKLKRIKRIIAISLCIMLVASNIQTRRMQATEVAVGLGASALASILLAIVQDACRSASMSYNEWKREHDTWDDERPVFVNGEYVKGMTKEEAEKTYSAEKGYTKIETSKQGSSAIALENDICYEFYDDKTKLVTNSVGICQGLADGDKSSVWAEVVKSVITGFMNNQTALDVFNEIRAYFYKQMVAKAEVNAEIKEENFQMVGTSMKPCFYLPNWSDEMKEYLFSSDLRFVAFAEVNGIPKVLILNKVIPRGVQIGYDSINKKIIYGEPDQYFFGYGSGKYNQPEQYFYSLDGYQTHCSYMDCSYRSGGWTSNKTNDSYLATKEDGMSTYITLDNAVGYYNYADESDSLGLGIPFIADFAKPRAEMEKEEEKTVAVPKAIAVPREIAEDEEKAKEGVVAVPSIVTDKSTDVTRELTVDDVVEGVRADDVGELVRVKDIADAKTDTVVDVVSPVGTIDRDELKMDVNINRKFPFCIPWDLIDCVKALSATGKAPKFNFPFKIGKLCNETVTIDFSQFEQLAVVVRYFTTLSYIVGLVLLTRNTIRG